MEISKKHTGTVSDPHYMFLFKHFLILQIKRAKVSNWFLVISVRSKDIPDGNRDAIYEPLIKELLALEQGVLLQDGSILKAGVALHLGDNLEAIFYTKIL